MRKRFKSVKIEKIHNPTLAVYFLNMQHKLRDNRSTYKTALFEHEAGLNISTWQTVDVSDLPNSFFENNEIHSVDDLKTYLKDKWYRIVDSNSIQSQLHF